jgi:hypothetical protein
MYPNEFNTVTYYQLPQILFSSLKQFLLILDEAKEMAVLEVKDGSTLPCRRVK